MCNRGKSDLQTARSYRGSEMRGTADHIRSGVGRKGRATIAENGRPSPDVALASSPTTGFYRHGSLVVVLSATVRRLHLDATLRNEVQAVSRDPFPPPAHTLEPCRLPVPSPDIFVMAP